MLPNEASGARHVYHQFTVRVTGSRRDALRAFLAERGIDTAIYYPKAVHQLAPYASLGSKNPVAEAAAGEVLSLPLWPRISSEIQERVASAIGKFFSLNAPVERETPRQGAR